MDGNENYIELTDVVDAYSIGRMQSSFSRLTGMAVQVFDVKGRPVTECARTGGVCSECGCGSLWECLRNSEMYDLAGSGSAVPTAPFFYRCRNGLTMFVAALAANEQPAGLAVGGRVLADNNSAERVRNAALALNDIAEAISDIADKTYKLRLNSIEAINASKVKSDFLANMSHEIRTPMNAVLGMVDLALREDMPKEAREYVGQIKVAGKNLLVIINDILDFSKIESGKMEIIPDDYEPLSVLNDVANIINTRIGDKEIEFTMDISPDIPRKLYGDSFHIHQVFINILNNAVKFTRKGNVNLSVGCEFGENDNVVILISVSDTGIGIKDEDKVKLFNSFQQVDSKRNRNIEGTGLGLAITKSLLTMMNGDISFESEYKKGTTFNIRLPQKCVERMPAVEKSARRLRVFIKLDNEYLKRQLIKDLGRVGAEYKETDDLSVLDKERPDFLILDKNELSNELVLYFEKNSDLKCLAVAEFSSRSSSLLPNVRIIRKPIYSLELYNALGLSDIRLFSDNVEPEEFKFVAPTANILIVDDNAVNLTVAKGLLEPLKMNVDLAGNAGEAIELIMEKEYDVIFMDHMMPEVDGVEATHMIRRLMPEYDSVPIIALTANAVNGAKEMFLAEGMADFVAKPIDIKDISAKLYKWLPKDKIVPVENDTLEVPQKQEEPAIVIEGLDTATAVKGLGGPQLYMTVLNEYYRAISSKAEVIKKYHEAGDIRNYTVEVHSLKSTSRQIGAMELGELAAQLEAAGKEYNTKLIDEKTDTMLAMYLALKEKLKPHVTVEEEQTQLKAFSSVEVNKLLNALAEALASFDALEIDEIVGKLSEYEYRSDIQKAFLEEMKAAAEMTDIDTIEKIINMWKSEL